MDVLEGYDRALDEFDRRIREIPVDRWDDPTPCEDWRVRDLVEHVVTEQRWVPELLAGATIEEIGDRFDDEQVGDDPEAAWSSAAAAATSALHEPGALDRTVQTSAGELDAAEYARQLTLELAVHAWDLARATGTDERLDDRLVADLLAEVQERRDEFAASERFSEPVRIHPSADEETRLLALLGRSR